MHLDWGMTSAQNAREISVGSLTQSVDEFSEKEVRDGLLYKGVLLSD